MPLISLRYALLTAAGAAALRFVPTKRKNAALLLLSLIFYAAAEPLALAFAVGDAALCFGAARLVERLQNAGRRRGALLLTGAAAMMQIGLMLALHGRVAGVSYVALMLLGDVLTVYHGEVKAPRDAMAYGALSLFYPKAAQGPIVSARVLSVDAPPDWETSMKALLRILWGLCKKLILADRLAIYVAAAYAAPEVCGAPALGLALVGYVFQVYADFSGCMDIVWGSARLLGVTLPENFRQPYLAKGFADYWQRWHITLGAWFRAHVFYPLASWPPLLTAYVRVSGRVKGQAAKRALAVLIPLMATWLCTGLWHGAAGHYALWGLTNGALILWESCFGGRFLKAPRAVRTAVVFAVQLLVRVLFRAESLVKAGAVYAGLLRFGQCGFPVCALDGWDWAVIAVFTALLVLVDVQKERGKAFRPKPAARFALGMLGLLALTVFGLYGPGYSAAEFFYGQF